MQDHATKEHNNDKNEITYHITQVNKPIKQYFNFLWFTVIFCDKKSFINFGKKIKTATENINQLQMYYVYIKLYRFNCKICHLSLE